ncbi:hypothetical protein [Chroococcus sp. FPU101]|uniref:hypothetical protein n=1 Tax=Chroococcus sp. FPU101 TaxID=1974212 RepID=UPI001A8F2603|nr:hypothetical protein [Chroococcus sp. FPU101]GFE72180.1 hypothetical protein CFPU101_47900 [Chroococcus sp. FPU101]
MRFLPIYRWQGGLLGSFVGQWLPQFSTDTRSVLPYLQIGQHLIDHLVEKNQLSEQDWLNIYQQYPRELKKARSADLILVLLPLILYEHDSQRELEQQIDLMGLYWQKNTEITQNVLIWGYLCSLVLKEQFHTQRTLDHLIQIPQTRQSSLIDLLDLVKDLLNNAVPLCQGMKQLISQGTPHQLAIALSLYCFASTPENFQLSILRASQIAEQFPVSLALTGFLSGIYNSISGFPVRWRVATQNCPLTLSIQHKTVQLFASWSGVYDLDTEYPLLKTSLASVSVIQRRHLNIVSQDSI